MSLIQHDRRHRALWILDLPNFYIDLDKVKTEDDIRACRLNLIKQQTLASTEAVNFLKRYIRRQ